MKSKRFVRFILGCALKASFASALLEIGQAQAQTVQCDSTEDYCVPFVGCIEKTGEIFRGRTHGLVGGPLIADSSSGASCVGLWEKTYLGIGVARFECDDGRNGASVYTYFEERTGTAVGKAEMTNGQVGKFWAGWNLEAYFREVAPEERQSMACEVNEMLLS
ncbi:hypothetical protein OU789_00055 [Halocynthiibacter sp. C4]|uniref:hypothetical protein n=1 Tax=Halocynthiibacter sp. C4 TaxID=2992758 RepID=UPI00237BFCF6|nr:hypothetical protein [Halocynthiibacter sp. C4]MDE0588311.1 hypothetical protein [Halocynthiibacter sp. C4]